MSLIVGLSPVLAKAAEENVPTYRFDKIVAVTDSSLGNGIEVHLTSDFMPDEELFARDVEVLCKYLTPNLIAALRLQDGFVEPNFISISRLSGGFIGTFKSQNFGLEGDDCGDPL